MGTRDVPSFDDVAFWALEHVTAHPLAFWAVGRVTAHPSGAEQRGLICVPLPREEGGTIRAAVAVYESGALARAGLEHYLARTGQEEGGAADPSHRVLALTPRELVGILEARPEGGGFERVAINPILSRYFEDAEGYSASPTTEEFIVALKEKFGLKRR